MRAQLNRALAHLLKSSDKTIVLGEDLHEPYGGAFKVTSGLSTAYSERVISNAINQELGKNFFQLINEYRVEEVKERLKDSDNDHLKILSLAFEAGFNSKASFNRVFKSFTGQTPKDYKSENS